MDEILTHVQSSLSVASASTINGKVAHASEDQDGIFVLEEKSMHIEGYHGYHEDIDFDDGGEGIGVEGDLDLEED